MNKIVKDLEEESDYKIKSDGDPFYKKKKITKDYRIKNTGFV